MLKEFGDIIDSLNIVNPVEVEVGLVTDLESRTVNSDLHFVTVNGEGT